MTAGEQMFGVAEQKKAEHEIRYKVKIKKKGQNNRVTFVSGG